MTPYRLHLVHREMTINNHSLTRPFHKWRETISTVSYEKRSLLNFKWRWMVIPASSNANSLLIQVTAYRPNCKWWREFCKSPTGWLEEEPPKESASSLTSTSWSLSSRTGPTPSNTLELCWMPVAERSLGLALALGLGEETNRPDLPPIIQSSFISRKTLSNSFGSGPKTCLSWKGAVRTHKKVVFGRFMWKRTAFHHINRRLASAPKAAAIASNWASWTIVNCSTGRRELSSCGESCARTVPTMLSEMDTDIEARQQSSVSPNVLGLIAYVPGIRRSPKPSAAGGDVAGSSPCQVGRKRCSWGRSWGKNATPWWRGRSTGRLDQMLWRGTEGRIVPGRDPPSSRWRHQESILSIWRQM